ncbi:type II secretion system minor pseudopilin GspK [Shewanella yunxiaonensis]|uniref:Type II secretion system protein K n=1 Tax=Shewanella yunxiaonensis TaxID=2829809 RepID=A0ABX7YUP7_9GAMM|nr:MULTISPECIES: type II secretion system minor pseudopilin GspK [Shewanella]MDF0534570.1 type II secretion system minor pseudopilin GspK [Shewanella sp. A32]QUN06049.1 type II secretion system minor pseudopilin GspK [Shewanella yunxiaonensis]
MQRKQRGVALIVVLLVVAIIAVLAVSISGRNQVSVRRTINMAEYDQAYWYAISAEELARKVLKQDLDDAEGRVHLQQYWALSNAVFPAEVGQIGGTISDLRSCFNLNSLSQTSTTNKNTQVETLPVAAKQYKALLEDIGIDEFNAERLMYTLKDYLDADTDIGTYGAEDDDYEARKVPYRAANTLMSDRSELRAVLGYSQEIYRKLLPYVCVIPGNNTQVLNVNTVKVEQAALLAAMLENKISVGEAESIINQRASSGFDKVDDFWQQGSLASIASQDDQMKSSFAVSSKFFMLDGRAKVDDAVFHMQSVLHVIGGNKLEVLTRQYGGQ